MHYSRSAHTCMAGPGGCVVDNHDRWKKCVQKYMYANWIEQTIARERTQVEQHINTERGFHALSNVYVRFMLKRFGHYLRAHKQRCRVLPRWISIHRPCNMTLNIYASRGNFGGLGFNFRIICGGVPLLSFVCGGVLHLIRV